MSTLKEELQEIPRDKQVSIAEVWDIPKKQLDKRNLIPIFLKHLTDEYYIKGILERLTPLQVRIYTLIIGSKIVLTLGEIARKVKMQPINIEKELAVLKYLLLVYQKKNRERITNTLDKYHPFEEISALISVSVNDDSEKFKLSIKKMIQRSGFENLNKKYISIVGKKINLIEFSDKTIEDSIFDKIIHSFLNEKELVLLVEAFNNGGILEINSVRIILDEQKLDIEPTLKKLDDFNILKDVYYVDERFVRVLSIPVELFDYLVRNPIFIPEEGIKERQDQTVCNRLDFILNMKRLLLFISNKGITLSQSEKLKQSDMRRSEEYLVEIDRSLFREKSQIYQIEVILPILKLFELIDIRGDNIILEPSFENFVNQESLSLLEQLTQLVLDASEKRMVGSDIFLPFDIPFYKQEVLNTCVNIIHENKGVYAKVMIAQNIRETVILSPNFKIMDFKMQYLQKRGLLVSSLFYMNLFGLLDVKYPERWINLSELGEYIFFKKEIRTHDDQNALYVNSDATVIAMPEHLSLQSLHLLKSFAYLKSFDNIYTFQLTKESLQEGILLGNSISEFKDFLHKFSKNQIPQNIMFSIEEWTNELPVVNIEEGVILLETSNAELKEKLLGSFQDKKIIRKDLSPTALVIEKGKVPDVMLVAEKLEMIVKLVR